MPAVTPNNTSVTNFIDSSGVSQLLAGYLKIRAAREKEGRSFYVSDVSDADGNQYVDLVQEGGGVWGIALLGYTYILEKAGIRFFSLAGTSAGAINTMLLAAAGEKKAEKSETIISHLLQLNMFSFVDGKKDNWAITHWVKKIIQKFIVKTGYVKRLKYSFLIYMAILILLTFFCLAGSFFIALSALKWISTIALVFWVVGGAVVSFIIFRIKTLIKKGYGLNEGTEFYKWIENILKEFSINNLEDLKNSFNKVPTQLNVKWDQKRDENVIGKVKPPSSPMLIIVASDLTTGNKVEFPRMWDLYWQDLKNVPPAAFVRASMSIPFFFETYKIKVSPGLQTLQKTWKNHLNWQGAIPYEVALVDGGVLSNFPINVFYNAKYIIPRMPTFGIRLGDENENKANSLSNLGGYLGSLISTLRSTTDKEFLNKYKAFSLGVKTVDLTGHSWLNFFLEDKEKKELFRKGAQAAIDFLLAFDWPNYKDQRLDNASVLDDQKKNPNNW